MSANMSSLVVCFVLHVILASVARCDVKMKQIPSHRKESSTTFIRLTALRDDEGLWVSRFGEYEVRTRVSVLPGLCICRAYAIVASGSRPNLHILIKYCLSSDSDKDDDDGKLLRSHPTYLMLKASYLKKLLVAKITT